MHEMRLGQDRYLHIDEAEIEFFNKLNSKAICSLAS
jgi:hypothetical protein